MIGGLDPGTTEGAFVVRQEAEVPVWGVWSRVAKGYRVTTDYMAAPEVRMVADIFSVGRRLADVSLMAGVCPVAGLEALAIEGLFVVGGAGAFPLIESVGEIRAGLRFGGLRWASELRPVAVSRSKKAGPGWRLSVLGLPNSLGATAAEDAAIEWAMTRGLPRGITRAEAGAWSEGLAMTYVKG